MVTWQWQVTSIDYVTRGYVTNKHIKFTLPCSIQGHLMNNHCFTLFAYMCFVSIMAVCGFCVHVNWWHSNSKNKRYSILLFLLDPFCPFTVLSVGFLIFCFTLLPILYFLDLVLSKIIFKEHNVLLVFLIFVSPVLRVSLCNVGK